MVFDREIRLTILGNAGVGKSSLVQRMKGELEIQTQIEKTTDIIVERKKIKLLSQKKARIISIEKYRWYEIVAVDTPGDFTLRRQWRVAMARYKADGIIFLLDPTQSVMIQKTAIEDAFNYFLDSLDMKPHRADKIAKEKRALFYFIVNKIDLIDNSEQKAREFLNNFNDTIKAYRVRFPNSKYKQSFISVHKSPYEKIDSIFENAKTALYD